MTCRLPASLGAQLLLEVQEVSALTHSRTALSFQPVTIMSRCKWSAHFARSARYNFSLNLWKLHVALSPKITPPCCSLLKNNPSDFYITCCCCFILSRPFRRAASSKRDGLIAIPQVTLGKGLVAGPLGLSLGLCPQSCPRLGPQWPGRKGNFLSLFPSVLSPNQAPSPWDPPEEEIPLCCVELLSGV